MPNLLAQNQLSPDLYEMLISENLDYTDHEPQNFARRQYEDFLYAFKENSIYIKLVDNVQKDVVSFIKLETELHFNEEYKVIKLSYSRFPQRGHVRYIFSILLFDFAYHLMSDSLNTIPGSMNFWKKIRLLKNSECRILNILTRYSRKYQTQADHLIWGLDDEYFLNDELNALFVDHFWNRKVINSDLYEYILENQNKIKNRQHLRLTIRVHDDEGG